MLHFSTYVLMIHCLSTCLLYNLKYILDSNEAYQNDKWSYCLNLYKHLLVAGYQTIYIQGTLWFFERIVTKANLKVKKIATPPSLLATSLSQLPDGPTCQSLSHSAFIRPPPNNTALLGQNSFLSSATFSQPTL